MHPTGWFCKPYTLYIVGVQKGSVDIIDEDELNRIH